MMDIINFDSCGWWVLSSIDLFFRVPDMPKSLAVSRDKVEKLVMETLSDLGREDIATKDFVAILLDLFRKRLCVYEIVREIRVLGYDMGLGEVLEVIQRLRENGYIRFISVKNPDRFEKAELVAVIPEFEVEKRDYTEALQEIDVEKLQEEVKEILTGVEEKKEEMPVPEGYRYAEIEEKRREEIRDLAKSVSEKLRVILEPQVALSPHIKHIVIATRDGLPIIQVNKKDVAPLDEEHVAAAISVVVSQSFQTAMNLNKKGFLNVLVRTDKAVIISSYIDSNYVLTIVMDVNTPMGLIYSDFNSVKKLILPELVKK